MNRLRSPAWRASRAVSSAYSRKTVGSTYVYAIDSAPSIAASATTPSGGSGRVGSSSPRRGPWAISQFWQNVQWNGQPAVAIEYAVDPGATWKSGFFSIGSRQLATTAPYA